MNDSRQNLWAVIGVLIFIGVCVGLGIYAHSIWVPLLVIAGTVIAFWGASEGTNDHPGRFLILTIVGIGLVAVALWLAQFAGRWLWTPIFLILCLAPFVGGSELRKNDHNFAGLIGYLLGFACLVFAVAGPLFLYNVTTGKGITFSFEWWMVWLALGLISAGLAFWQANAWNPGRFVLFALLAVVFTGLATVEAQVAGRWLWIIPWAIVAGLIGFGAAEVKRYRDWAGNIGYFFALLCVAAAVLAPTWLFKALPIALPEPAAQITTPQAVPTNTALPTEAPAPTAISTQKAPSPQASQTSSGFSFVMQFLGKAFTSIWGIFHLLLIALLGELWIRRWGAPIFLLALLGATWWIGAFRPELQAGWLGWISSSPVSWMSSVLDYSIRTFHTPGIGIITASLVMAILLFPATRLSLRANQTLREATALNNILGSTAALRYMNLKGVSQGRIIISTLLNLVMMLGLSISLWIALQDLAKSNQYLPGDLGFLFVPDITVPSFKPVWQWQYFAFGGLFWVAFVILTSIQKKYLKILPYAGCQNPIVSLVTTLISAMLIPAGVLLFSIVQFVCQWIIVPLSFVGGKEIVREEPVEIRPEWPAEEAKPEPPWESPGQPEEEPNPWEQITPSEPAPSMTIPVTPAAPEILGEIVATSPAPIVGFAINNLGECLVLTKNGNLSLYEDGISSKEVKLDLAAPLGLICAAREELVAIGKNGRIIVIDGQSEDFRALREGSLSIPVQSYALNPFGSMLACVHPDATKVCGIFLGKMEEKIFSDQITSPTAIGFSKDGRYLGVGCEDGSVHILDIATRQETVVLEVEDLDLEGPVQQVAGSIADGAACWVVTYDNEAVAQWSLEGELIESIDLSFTPNCLAVNPDSGLLAVGGKKGQVEVYSVELDLEFESQMHASRVIQLTFDKTSDRLYSAGGDQIVKVVNV